MFGGRNIISQPTISQISFANEFQNLHIRNVMFVNFRALGAVNKCLKSRMPPSQNQAATCVGTHHPAPEPWPSRRPPVHISAARLLLDFQRRRRRRRRRLHRCTCTRWRPRHFPNRIGNGAEVKINDVHNTLAVLCKTCRHKWTR